VATTAMRILAFVVETSVNAALYGAVVYTSLNFKTVVPGAN